MRRTVRFVPKFHGFQYRNGGSEVKWEVLGITGTLICGGMAYAALDYFYAGMAVPRTRIAPRLNTPLQEYIQSRQETAHVNTGLQFGANWVHPTCRATRPDDEFLKLKGFINKSQPMPICLATHFKGHHLVAYGYDDADPYTIYTYDPNHPGQTTLIQKIMDGSESSYFLQNSVDSGHWKTFFVDAGYTKKIPTVPGMISGWRKCSHCHGLFYGENATLGVCPAGGAHDLTGSSNYTLTSSTGQAGWKWCYKCEGLFFTGRGIRSGKCPAGTTHDGSYSASYMIAHQTGTGEAGWRWCNRCEGLFFAATTTAGTCPGGIGHDSTGSGSYWVKPVRR